jgi:hypothetical protein
MCASKLSFSDIKRRSQHSSSASDRIAGRLPIKYPYFPDSVGRVSERPHKQTPSIVMVGALLWELGCYLEFIYYHGTAIVTYPHLCTPIHHQLRKTIGRIEVERKCAWLLVRCLSELIHRFRTIK